MASIIDWINKARTIASPTYRESRFGAGTTIQDVIAGSKATPGGLLNPDQQASGGYSGPIDLGTFNQPQGTLIGTGGTAPSSGQSASGGRTSSAPQTTTTAGVRSYAAPSFQNSLTDLQARQMADYQGNVINPQIASAEEQTAALRSLAQRRADSFKAFAEQQRPQLEKQRNAALGVLGTGLENVQKQVSQQKTNLTSQYEQAQKTAQEQKSTLDQQRAQLFAARGIADSSYYANQQTKADSEFLTNIQNLEQSKATQLLNLDTSLTQAQAEFEQNKVQVENQYLNAMSQIEYNLDLNDFQKESAIQQLESELVTRQSQIQQALYDLQQQQAAIRYQAAYDALNSSGTAATQATDELYNSIKQQRSELPYLSINQGEDQLGGLYFNPQETEDKNLLQGAQPTSYFQGASNIY